MRCDEGLTRMQQQQTKEPCSDFLKLKIKEGYSLCFRGSHLRYCSPEKVHPKHLEDDFLAFGEDDFLAFAAGWGRGGGCVQLVDKVQRRLADHAMLADNPVPGGHRDFGSGMQCTGHISW